MNEFLVLFLITLLFFLTTLLCAYASLGIFYAISMIRLKAKCRRITRELDQAFADAENRVKNANPQKPQQ